MSDTADLFPASYEESRQRFRGWLQEISSRWPDATLHQYALHDYPELTIDWITAEGQRTNEQTLVITTGEHGVEGYVGSAMLELFLRKYLTRLDSTTTGLTLVHAINPWGMKHHRRVNPHNVDLNRNFVLEVDQLDRSFNPFYSKIDGFVSPGKRVVMLRLDRVFFQLNYWLRTILYGREKFWTAKVLGQYAYPNGIHYGGTVFQEEVKVLQQIYRQLLASSKRVLHLDMHTGYGPRYQMTIVNSPLEVKSSSEFAREFDYPLVAAMTAEEFYEVSGDMIDYVYHLHQKEFPSTELYATAFEFGTFGDGHRENLRSLRAMVFENQLYWHGASSQKISEWIRREFLESFSPSESVWRQKAVADAEQAFEGILHRMSFIKNSG